MNAASAPSQSPPLRVSLGPGHRTLTFSHPFRIGRAEECEVSIQNEYASRAHSEVFFENGKWWVRDLNSSNGLYHDGRRVERVPITQSTTVRLGVEGPEISFEPQMVTEPYRVPTDPLREYPSRGSQLEPAIPKTSGSGTILRQYV